MLLIRCPWCGPRAEVEFQCGGETHVERPKQPETLTDAEWGDYVFFKRNPKGVHYERWLHAAGCRRWFNVARSTVTHEIFATYKPGEPKPEIEA